jgi:hypothetical protein
LLEGIQLHLKDEQVIEQVYETCSFSIQGLELLNAVTHQDMCSLGVGDDISVLCSVTESDYFGFLNWVDPMIELKSRFNLHNYKCESSQGTIKQFITKKIKKFKKMNENQGEGGHCLPAPDFESLDEVIKRIKNTDIMSQLEVELRSKLAQLQDLYRDKQKEMSRLKSSPKKVASGSRSRTRGPGRPKKRCLKSSAKTKMGRPRKRRHSEEDLNEEVEDEEEEEDDDVEEEEANLSPPILQPWSTSSRSPSPPSLFHHLDATKPTTSGTSPVSVAGVSGGLLKPPKLTASFSPQSSSASASVVRKFGSASNSVTNLSMINARFMKGKANPFQNLMKLATVPSGPGNSKDDSSSSTDEDDPIGKDKVRESSAEQTVAKESADSGGDRKYSDPEDGSASKRRKCDKPRRHCGSTETIVHKQPKNLFMMNCMTLQRGFSEKSSKVDEYDFRENEEDDEDECDDAVDAEDRWGSKSKMFSQYRDSAQPATPPPTVAATLARSKPAWSPSAIIKPQQPTQQPGQPLVPPPQQQQQPQQLQPLKAASPLVCCFLKS